MNTSMTGFKKFSKKNCVLMPCKKVASASEESKSILGLPVNTERDFEVSQHLN